MNQALAGVRVVEVGEGIAAPFCARMLAGMGADVVKVEPPGGDGARGWASPAVFLYCNTDKAGITLDLARGQGLFKRLVAGADVLIEDRPPGVLDYAELSAINPRLIVTSITPYGQTGPYKDYKAEHLNLYHAGGEGYMLPGGMSWELFPERPPLQAGGYAGYYDAGIVAACATMVAMHVALATGRGQHVDCSMQEAQIALNRESVSSYTYLNRLETRATRSYSSGGMLPCKDGYVFVQGSENHFWKGLVDFMGSPEWAKDPALDTMAGRREHWEQIKPFVREWTMGLTQKEIVEGCRERGVPVGMYASPQQVLDSEQLAARCFFTEVEHPEAGGLRYPTAAFQMSETPWRTERAAPRLGEHNRDIYCGRLGLSDEELASLEVEGVV